MFRRFTFRLNSMQIDVYGYGHGNNVLGWLMVSIRLLTRDLPGCKTVTMMLWACFAVGRQAKSSGRASTS